MHDCHLSIRWSSLVLLDQVTWLPKHNYSSSNNFSFSSKRYLVINVSDPTPHFNVQRIDTKHYVELGAWISTTLNTYHKVNIPSIQYNFNMPNILGIVEWNTHSQNLPDVHEIKVMSFLCSDCIMKSVILKKNL